MTVAANKLGQVYPDLVAHLAEDDLTYLAAALELQRVEAGEAVLEHGKSSDRLFLIAEGDLAIELPTEHGSVDLGRRGAGRWVGELGVIEPGPASATVRAATDATLWVLTHAAFQTMRAENPCAAARVMEEVSKDVAARLRSCNTVLFRRAEAGNLEVIPKQDAPEGFLSKLIHDIKDIFDLEPRTLKGDAVPDRPLKPAMSLATFLRDHTAFGALSEEDRTHLQQACDVKEFPDGHMFIREGDARDAVYFVLDGQVEVAVHKPKDASFAVDRIMGPGEIIGLVALLDRGKRSATCAARGPLKVAVLTLEGANLLMNTHARLSCAFQHALARQMAHDARNLNESLLDAASHPDA